MSWFFKREDSESRWISKGQLTGLLVVVGLFALGYALRPVQQIFDDLHDSEDSDEEIR